MLCLNKSGGDGDSEAARVDNSLNINWQSTPFNNIITTSNPVSFNNTPALHLNTGQAPSRPVQEYKLLAPPAPSPVEAQARANLPNLGLTTSLVPVSKSHRVPLRCTMLPPIIYRLHIPTPKLQQLPAPSFAETQARLLSPTSFHIVEPPSQPTCHHSAADPNAFKLRLRASSLPWFPTRPSLRLNARAKPWTSNEPSPPPTVTPTFHQPPSTRPDPLVIAAASMGQRLRSASSTTSVIKSLQQPMVRAPTSAYHPAHALLDSYATDGFPAAVGAPWPISSILAAIATGPHKSTLAKDSVHFVREELFERTTRGFSIILTKDDALKYFGDRLRISRLASVDQKNRKPRLICNSTAAPDDLTPSVNASTDSSSNPNAIQFGSCLPRVLQKIWEADPADGPVFLSKWDISDAFHRCNLRPGDVGSFAYVIPALPTDTDVLLCIDLVLPMGWVNSPDLFCSTSETVADIANQLINQPDTPTSSYGPTHNLYHTISSPTASPSRLQHADVYVDDINCVAQGDALQQQRVTELILRALKDIYPAVPGETKDSVSLKKALAGDGDWSQTKEILGWVIDTRLSTLRLSHKRTADLLLQLDIPPTQRKMRRKRLEVLIGKLRSMHLAIPGAISHFYYLQQALTKATPKVAYLSNNFHTEVRYWKQLVEEMEWRPTHLAEIVQRYASALGFTDASGLGAGGVWINPNADGHNFVWRFEWPADIVSDLVSWDNPRGRITNSDLELAALVLQEAVFPLICPNWAWHAPVTGSDNTPTVSWTFKEAATINPVVADLLRIRSIINRNATITPSVCYHPGVDNTMADDASRKFTLCSNSFMSFFNRKYHPQQSPCSWTLCHPPIEVLSSVISALRKQPFAEVTYHPPAHPSSTPNGPRSAPPSRSTTACKAITSQPSRSFKCMDTGSVTATTLSKIVSGRTRLQRRGALLQRPTFWKASTTPANPAGPQ